MARRPPGDPFSPTQRGPRRTKKSKSADNPVDQSARPDELHRQATGADATTGIAAPLLAGAAFTITGVVVQQPTALRWPGVAILLLVVAGSLLISAVQLGVLARRYGPSPDEVAAWRQAEMVRPRPDEKTFTDAVVVCAWWADNARWAYSLGIIALWAGVAVAVMPTGAHEQPMWRWAAAAVASGLAVLEVGSLVAALAARTRPDLFRPVARARRRYYGDDS